MSQPPLPVGVPVSLEGPGTPPASKTTKGRYVTLTPVSGPHATVLFPPTHGTPEAEQVWTYLGYGPFGNEGAMKEWMEGITPSTEPLFFSVLDSEGIPIGVVSYLNIVPDARRLELGHIWYIPSAQRTRANTEVAYLMLCETFDVLNYRRAEWKCDSLNARSRAAALRLGFKPEGIFRQHLVYKSRNRDTAWFSMLDSEWPSIKANLEAWLYEGDKPGFSLTERHTG